ncbi:MAG TPA: lactate utilization protein [Candidatus Levybacteria bacterium]|nr:lactate utilization protein [Candidatus Levybacteria bacterium]
MKHDTLPSTETIEKTAEKLKEHNFKVEIVQTGAQAKEKALTLIPKGSEIMTATSVTLDTIGLAETLNDSGKYDSIKQKLSSMSRDTQHRDMQRLGAAPEYVIGSVHAITEDGVVMIASNSGSQLPAYAYGADHVVWVVGAQKIVKNLDDGFKRIYEHSLPLESERAKKAYGVPGSFVSKILILNKEPQRDITIILVNEVLGY